MNPGDLTTVGANVWQREILSGASLDNAVITEKTVLRSRFLESGFLKAQFRDCTFNHSYFERCYFRQAQFSDTSFIGCQFRDCRFDEAAFSACHFDHAEFDNCAITYSQLANSLPGFHNVLWELARNLRVNAQNRGATEDSRAFLLQEIRASATHHYKVAFGWNDPYFGPKYRWEQRWASFRKWAVSTIEGIVWGYGEVPIRVVWASSGIVLAFAIIYRWSGMAIRNMPQVGFLEHLGFSAATFATMNYGDVLADSAASRLTTTAEACLGLLFFGFLTAAAYRKISRR